MKRPVILFVDGHSTHISQEASDFCVQNNVVLYCLLEHASHLIQPCDLRFFSSLKKTCDSALRDWQVEHAGQYVTKFEFASIFKHAWDKSAKTENAVSGFRDAGLFPFSKDVVLKTDKLQMSRLFVGTADSSSSVKTAPRPDHDSNSNDGETSTGNMESSSTEHSYSLPAADAFGLVATVPDVLPEELTSTPPQSPSHTVCHEVESVPSTSNEETNLNVADMQSPARAILKAIDQNKGPKVVVQCVNSAESPLSKFLKLPEPKQNKKQKAKKEILPKAVTGIEFRKILEEKKEKAGGCGSRKNKGTKRA